MVAGMIIHEVMKCGGLSPSLYSNCSNIHVEIEVEEDEERSSDGIQDVLEYSQRLTSGGGTRQDVVDTSLVDNKQNFKDNTLAYIAGYVVAKLCANVTCQPCCAALESSPQD